MARMTQTRIRSVVISLLVILTLAVPVAFVTFPHLYRWRMLQGLHSQDEAQLTRSVNWVAAHAEERPAVLEGAIRKLNTAQDTHFTPIAQALQAAGKWDRPTVGDDAWLRWIGMLIEGGNEEARIAATQHLAAMVDTVDHEALARQLVKLADDESADVRINVLIAAAELAGVTHCEKSVQPMIAGFTADPEPEIARHAWIFCGLLGTDAPQPESISRTPPRVAEAALWSRVMVDPTRTSGLLVTSRDAPDPMTRAAAAYALSFTPAPEGEAHVLAQVAINHSQDGEVELVGWRAILGTPNASHLRHMHDVIADYEPPEAWLPVRLALLYRLGDPALLPAELSEPNAAFEWLAVAEGHDLAGVVERVPDAAPLLLRVAAAGREFGPSAAVLEPAYRSEIPTLRDIAAVRTAAGLPQSDPADAAALTRSLLADYNDDAKKSGAILAGMTRTNLDLLRKRYEAEDMHDVRMVMRLGLWMAGQDAGMNATVARSMLAREDLGIGSTVLLAMLHRGLEDPLAAREALDYLFNPRGDPSVDLVELFDKFRWWYVMEAYLPQLFDEPAPPFWLWADPALQRFQVDVLRDWYLIHRHTLAEPAQAP